jgi:hypothetical protein
VNLSKDTEVFEALCRFFAGRISNPSEISCLPDGLEIRSTKDSRRETMLYGFFARCSTPFKKARSASATMVVSVK